MNPQTDSQVSFYAAVQPQSAMLPTLARRHALFFILISILHGLFNCSGALGEDRHSAFSSLWESADHALQQELEKLVKDQGLWEYVQNKRLALAVVEMSDPLKPRLAHLNGNRMYYAASLPKIAILLGAFVEIQAGRLELNDVLHKQLTDMIRYSSNSAASSVLSLVGGERILEILQDREFSLYDPMHNGGLWVGKEYGKGSAFHRDPLHNYSHGATAVQAARFYYHLETYQLLNPQNSELMKEILSKPGIQHKFVKGLQQVPNIRLFRKSGSWRNYHADSALIEFEEHTYIIVGLSDSSDGGKWLEKLSLPLHKMCTGEK